MCFSSYTRWQMENPENCVEENKPVKLLYQKEKNPMGSGGLQPSPDDLQSSPNES
jgi:hypothetical protein